MKTLKGYVYNLAKPEAFMAKGYLKDESIRFVTEYLQRFDVVQQRVWHVDEEYGDAKEVPEGAGKPYVMSVVLHDATHQYILTNASVIQRWLT